MKLDDGEKIVLQAGNTYTHPLQQEWVACQTEMRRLRARCLEIKRALVDLERPCEVCGTLFRAVRLTRKYCSQACTVRAYVLRTNKNARYNLALIEEMLPAMKAAGLLSERMLSIVDTMLKGSNASMVADHMGVSRENVGQLLAKATRTAKLVKLIQDVSAGRPSSVGLPALGAGDTDL